MKKSVKAILAVLAVLLLTVAAIAAVRLSASAPRSSDAPDTPEVVVAELPHVAISEFMPKNHSTLTDGYGNFCDWAELENLGDETVELTGWSLSDKQGQARWCFDTRSLAPGEQLLVFLGGDESLPLHTGFSLSDGETLYLCNAEGAEVASAKCEEIETDAAYAPDGSGVYAPVFYATPGFPNTNEGYDAFCDSLVTASPLVINEVMTANLSYMSPYPCVTCDWVEVKNVSDADVLLSDYYLSDDDDDYKLWRFPEITLAAGECMTVYCSGDAESTSGRNYHTNFSLDAINEQLFLSDAEGKAVDFVHLHNISPDLSMGRISGQNGFFYLSQPTMSAENSDGLRRMSRMPSALSPDGVYDGVTAVGVELLADRGQIYYTTDGSLPTQQSTPYTGAISLEKTTIVRAIAVEDGAYPSKALTLSYIINENHTLPVLSLVVDNVGLFDSMFKIGQRDYFIQANLALYEDGCRFSSPCGVTMKGWTSLTMYKKSLGVYFKGIYGTDMLNCDIFGNGISEYSSLSIRAGQDYNRAIFRNELFQNLCLEMTDSVLTQESKYCILYVNGRYWGIYCLKEDFSRQFYASHAKVSKDSVEVQKAPARRSSPFFSQLVTYSWVSDPLSDEYYNTMSERMDIDSLIDWFILEGYSANVDVRGNVRYFRSSENGNRWQFGFYDLDWAFYHSGSCYVNIFEELGNAGNEMPTLVKTMLRNPTFRQQFIQRYAQVIKTTLSNEHVLEKIDEYQALLEPEVARDRERWDIPQEDWYTFVNSLRGFVIDNDLENKTTETLRSYLNITDEEMAEYFGD